MRLYGSLIVSLITQYCVFDPRFLNSQSIFTTTHLMQLTIIAPDQLMCSSYLNLPKIAPIIFALFRPSVPLIELLNGSQTAVFLH